MGWRLLGTNLNLQKLVISDVRFGVMVLKYKIKVLGSRVLISDLKLGFTTLKLRVNV